MSVGRLPDGVSPLRRSGPRSRAWTRPLAVSVAVALLYTACVFAYSLHPASNVSISGTPWHALAVAGGFALVAVGVPVFLRLRYGLRGPVVLLGAILVFWHVLVEFPPIGTGRGDSPGFLFVFAWAPLYLVAYAVLAAAEYLLRGRSGFPAPSEP